MDLTRTQELVGLALSVLGLLGGIAAWSRVIRPRWKRGWSRLGAALDSVAGREAIIDNITGKELAPALPSIGMRMESVEVAQIETRHALNHIATLLEVQKELTDRVDGHDEKFEVVDKEIQELKEQAIERIAGKAESIAAYRAMEAVARLPGDPPADPAAPASLE